jgi:hypothetical protein
VHPGIRPRLGITERATPGARRCTGNDGSAAARYSSTCARIQIAIRILGSFLFPGRLGFRRISTFSWQSPSLKCCETERLFGNKWNAQPKTIRDCYLHCVAWRITGRSTGCPSDRSGGARTEPSSGYGGVRGSPLLDTEILHIGLDLRCCRTAVL